jgi:anaerobic magnesium-protoporphyrin IX monomethyl ester cyclase
MNPRPVVFITVLTYDNLGVGYMESLLAEEGFKTSAIDFSKKKSAILKILKRLDPLLIGFSVIFNNYIDQFAELIAFLREKGINCHITAGGHYASLRYEELFQHIPQLDSIVRFEGEYPIVELARSVAEGKEWRNIDSIAYKLDNKIHYNNVRPPETDLDKYPFPNRSAIKNYAFDKKFTTIIAGRGCIHNCSFCNTREYYRQALAPVKRIRKPEAVVSEMDYLFRKEGCSVFIFHDDDFPVRTSGKSDWTERFCNEIERRKLNQKIIWKINCRPDEIDNDRFAMMKKHGLFLVFVGLEDGTDLGLKRLNKHMSVAESLNGISILKNLGIDFDFGYILFQPVTTFTLLNQNLDFLNKICSDGYSPVTFLRLVPLYYTSIAEELEKAGRLKVTKDSMDYNFPEVSMDNYYDFVMKCFTEWLQHPDGVENISKWARNYFSVYNHFYNSRPEVTVYHNRLRKIISESNVYLLDTMKELSLLFETKRYNSDKNPVLQSYRREIKSKHSHYRAEIINNMAMLMSFAENHPIKS